MADTIIHIHEDDWGMRNLCPLAAQSEVAGDLAAAATAGEKNCDPLGYGWRDVHVIAQPSITFAQAGLLLSSAIAVLEPVMPRVRHFYATASFGFREGAHDSMGSYEDDAWCFGFDEQCYLYLGTEGDHVASIWFDLHSNALEREAALKRAVQAIDRLVPSMIADYFWSAEIAVADTAHIDRYFAALGGRKPYRSESTQQR